MGVRVVFFFLCVDLRLFSVLLSFVSKVFFNVVCVLGFGFVDVLRILLIVSNLFRCGCLILLDRIRFLVCFSKVFSVVWLISGVVWLVLCLILSEVWRLLWVKCLCVCLWILRFSLLWLDGICECIFSFLLLMLCIF